MRTLLEGDRLRQLIAVGPVLVSELDLDVMLARLLETACSVTAAKYAALGILDEQRRELERFITHGLSEEQERAIGERPRGRGVLGLVIEDPRPIRVADVTAHPQSFGFPARHPPMHSFLGVPVMIRGRAWGNLYLTEKRLGEFNDADEYAAMTLANWAAIAIDHARILAESAQRQNRLERAVRRLEATQAMAVAIGAETDLDRVLELVAEHGRAVVQARSVLIVLNESGGLAVASRAGDARAQIGTRIPAAEAAWEQVVVAKRPVRVDGPSSQLADSALEVADARAALLVPLLYHGEALGVMAAFDRDGGSPAFDADDEQVLTSFAASAATAVGQRRERERTG